MWSAIKFTFKNTWKSTKGLFVVYLLAQVILAVFSLVNTFTFKEIIDTANHSETILGLSLIGIILVRLLYELLKQLIDGGARYTWALLNSKQMIYYNDLFLKKVATLDVSKFENPNSVGLINRSYGRINQFTFYLKGIVEIIASLTELSVSIIIFTFASPLIALLIVITNILPIVVRSHFAKSSFRLYTADDETKRRFGYTADLITNRTSLPEIKLNQAFEFVKKRFLTLYSSFTNNQLKLEKKYQLVSIIVEILPITAVFIFSVLIATRLTEGLISTGTFVFLFTNVFVFSGALHKLNQNIGLLQQDGNPLNEVAGFFDIKPNVSFPLMNKDQYETLKNRLVSPTITLDRVSFKYPNTEAYVLKNISLQIPCGQNLAVIGENGAGKTTLVKLLLRIYDPTQGTIKINGIDLREIPEKLLFGVYSTLFQDFGKFYLTIRENLELAAGRKLNKEEIINYLKFSNAWEFIKDTKNQVEQQLGPEYTDGIDLSGGQWQRLAIARAYAKDSPILILDEPTSAVDARSEMEIFDRINIKFKNKTLIFISHRFSTIKDAEKIIVMNKGEIIEAGNHTKLMNSKGEYFKLYNTQAGRYKR
ncbi:ABC transporter ATP-binding protein [candidate division WWE3 bacterium]|jgi:ATP-binding cassette, subfamily B, bacterial|nr:ABC transporter ATP-binding protein [candidate division WWE3 bacterium]MBT7349260.1 ABC transporter ATP-binding protein [candidate division WWE3 bacterium]